MGKFRIKIASSWFSDEFVIYKYSENGIIWHKILTSEFDILDKRWYMKTLTTSYRSSESIINKFKTLDDVHKYEEENIDRVIVNNEKIDKRNKAKIADMNAIYKKFG